MANPTWFIEQDYLTSKLDKLKAADAATYSSWTTLQVKAAIEGAGLSTFDHFQAFNKSEGTSPNRFFNAYEYIEAKKAKLNADNFGGRNDWTNEQVKEALDGVGGAWAHYLQNGAAEGLNPSNAFSVSGYYAVKAAALGGTWTADTVEQYFKANGVNPLEHYLSFGVTETGVSPVAVPEGSRVPADPDANVGKVFTLTATAATTQTTVNNDTVDGSLLNSINGQTIVDPSSNDSDVMNIVVDGAVAPTRVLNIETVNLTAKYGAATVTGGSFTGVKKLNAASDIASGSITVNGASDVSIASIKAGANVATLAVATGANGSGAGVAVDAGAAKAVALTGTATKADVFNLTLNGGASTVTLGANLNEANDKLTIVGNGDANVVTIAGANQVKAIDLISAADVTLRGDADRFTGTTIKDATTGGTTSLVITAMTTASANLSKAAVDVIQLDKVTTGVTLANNANVKLNATDAVALTAADASSTLNLELLKATTGALTAGATTFTTVNVKADTVAVTNLNLAAGNTATVNLVGSKNITLANTSTAKDLNASALEGKLTATVTAGLLKVTGGAQADTVTVSNADIAGTAVINTGAGDDIVVLAGTGTLDDTAANSLKIDAGAGKDTLRLATAASDFSATDGLKAAVLTGFEVIDVNGQNLTLTQKQLFTNGNTFELADTTGGGTFTVAHDGASATVFDLSGITFTAGVAAPAITVNGSTGADTIIGTTANDTLNGGDGNDTITLTGGTDVVQLTGTKLTSAGGNTDTINGFTAGSGAGADTLQFGATLLDGSFATSANVVTGASNGFTSSNVDDIYIANTGSAADAAGVAGLLSGAFTSGADQKALFVINDASGNANIWYVNDALDGTNTDLTANDVVLIGTLTGVSAANLVAGNFAGATV